jgi:hypothetical protein
VEELPGELASPSDEKFLIVLDARAEKAKTQDKSSSDSPQTKH